MKSDTPKVMHALAGAPLLVHVLSAAKAASVEEICVVVGPGMDEVASVARGARSRPSGLRAAPSSVAPPTRSRRRKMPSPVSPVR